MVTRSNSAFEAELRVSARWVAGLLGLLSPAVLVLSEGMPASIDRLPVFVFCISASVLCVAVWLLDLWLPKASGALAITAFLAAVYGGALVLGLPFLLNLSGIAILLAVAMRGRRAAAITGLIEVILLGVWFRTHPAGSDGALITGSQALSIRILALLLVVGFVYAAYHRIDQLGSWLWQRYEFAQSSLSELRERKAELEQALEDLAHANRQLALANERVTALRAVAEEAQKAKATFVAKVSHELRTPLNMIIGLVTLMMEAPEIYAVTLSPEMKKDLGIVNRNCEHLSHMVNDVLNLTQMEAGRLVLHRERLDLRIVIDAAVQSVSPLLEKKGLYVRQEIPEDLPLIFCDPTRIQQVILNLVSNAARFTDVGGITLRIETQSREITVSVADTGLGIRPEDRERIFEPFCQGTLGPWQGRSGSGLGLTISKQFIEQHGGRIWLDSDTGRGTTFYFTLPTVEPMPHIVRPGHWINPSWAWLQRRSWAKFSDDHYRPRIVICDETGDLHAKLKESTDKVEFVDTRTVDQAIAALRECPAHTLLLNSRDPIDLPARVSEIQSEVTGTPIIGCSVPPLSERMQSAGATGYLVKPVTRQDLERVLKNAGKPIHTVLIADDDPEVLELFTRMLLICDASLSIGTAQGGVAALDSVHTSKPDLVLLDVFMPDIDGWKVLERLRGDEAFQDVPVYIVSAHDPATQPPGSRLLLAKMGEEFSLGKLLEASLTLSTLFLSPDGELHSELQPDAAEIPVSSGSS